MKMNFAKKATALAMSVLFAVSMAGCGSSASTAKKVEVTSVEDLADLKIGVQTGTTGDSQASDAVNADSQMQRYNKGADAIQALKNGKIDCVVIDSLPAEKFVAANDDLKIVEGIFDTEEYAMCFKKGNELRDEFNTALAELKEDGTLDEIMSNYIGDEVGQHPYESPADADHSKGTLTMATNAEFPPYESIDGDKVVGIDVDILAAIAEDQGFEYELKSLGWDAAIAACQSGQADAMIAGASITDERKASGWMFSDGYYDSNQTLTVPEDSDIAGFADLSGKNVAVKTGTQGASYAESLKDEYGFTITYFEDSPTMYQAVLGGQCVGCFEDTPIMKASIKDGALALKVLEDTASDPAPYGFAIFSEDSQELLDMFNKGLADIKANGKYDEILAKYLG